MQWQLENFCGCDHELWFRPLAPGHRTWNSPGHPTSPPEFAVFTGKPVIGREVPGRGNYWFGDDLASIVAEVTDDKRSRCAHEHPALSAKWGRCGRWYK